MRRGGPLSSFPEIACWRHSSKCSVRAAMVADVLVTVDQRINLIDLGRNIVDGVELVAPGAVAAFDDGVELGAFWGRYQLNVLGS